MERIESRYEPRQRAVTGEVVYFDDMRHQQEFPKRFSELDDETRAMYEKMAEEYVELGIRPDILDEYEKFDIKMSDAERSCVEMSDELLKHKHRENLKFASICIDVPPEEVLDKLKQTRIGNVLSGDDEQLAYESDGSYYPILDIKKKDATLTGVGLTVMDWDSEKTAKTDKPGETWDPNRHVLRYPSDENDRHREFILSFGYKSPNLKTRDGFSEKITFTVGESVTGIYREVYVDEYAEMGYEGHHGKTLKKVSDDDVIAMGNLIAEIVGENPESPSERKTKMYNEFLTKILSAESRQYVEEWVNNSWEGQVMADLQYKLKVDDVPLLEALTSPDLAPKAHEELVYHVDHKRHQKNHWARKYKESPIFNEEPPKSWRDGEFRST